MSFLSCTVGTLVYFNKTFIFGKPELHQEAAGASRGTNKTILSKQSTVEACFNSLKNKRCYNQHLGQCHKSHTTSGPSIIVILGKLRLLYASSVIMKMAFMGSLDGISLACLNF